MWTCGQAGVSEGCAALGHRYADTGARLHARVSAVLIGVEQAQTAFAGHQDVQMPGPVTDDLHRRGRGCGAAGRADIKTAPAIALGVDGFERTSGSIDTDRVRGPGEGGGNQRRVAGEGHLLATRFAVEERLGAAAQGITVGQAAVARCRSLAF